jgi:DNA-binding MarR family transcriptional regulator
LLGHRARLDKRAVPPRFALAAWLVIIVLCVASVVAALLHVHVPIPYLHTIVGAVMAIALILFGQQLNNGLIALAKRSPLNEPAMDPLLLDPTRLSIVALLVGTQWAEFGWVRDSVGLSDSDLSKQITKLSNTGYLEVRKGYVGKRPRTWLSLTESGHQALRAHVAALRKIVEQSQQAGSTHRADQPP